MLDPFVIAESNHVGYVATSTLAGTRINTNLRDLGAAISVVTPEFMKDTAVTSVEELLTYTTSTEIGGVYGNYSAAGLEDAAGRPDQDAVRREPQSGARVRGFATPNYTRGYFSTSFPTDSYNVGSITISRGANSLLFGLGSAGGVIESSPNQAMFGRSKGSASFRIGSHGSNRSTLDYNLALVPSRLALRLDVLDKTDNYQQRPTFDRQQRVYAALTGVLFENRNSPILGKTTVRANFEVGKGERNPPSALPPSLAYDSFFLPPPNFQPYTGIDFGGGGGYAMLSANWRKWATNNTQRIQTSAPGVTPVTYIPGWYENLATAVANRRPDLVSKNYSSSHFFQGLAMLYSSAGTPGIGIPGSNLQGTQGNIQQEPLGAVRTTAVTNNHIFTRAYTEGQQSVGFRLPTVSDPAIFDYRNRVITGDLQRINTRFDAASVTLEQSFFKNRLGFEGTLDKQFYHIDSYQPFGGTARNVPVYIDTSEFLINGTPNPNVGRALMVQASDLDQWRNTYRDNQRVTAYLDLDAKDLNPTLGKWLGRHILTGLWQKESTVVKGMNGGMYLVGNEFNLNQTVGGATTAAALANIRSNPLAQVVYISDDLRGKEMNEVRLNVISAPRARDGDTFSTIYYDRSTGAFKTGTVRAVHANVGAVGGGTDVTSKALAWQPKLLGAHLVGLVGFRKDTVETFRQANDNRLTATNEVLPSSMELSATPATTQSADTFTWSGVGHVPQRVMAKLPRFISSASFHYGVSENFQAIAERHDVNNRLLDSPRGTTKEFGLTLGFNRDTWSLKVNRFDSASANMGVLTSPNVTQLSITQGAGNLNNYQAAVNSGIPFNSLQNINVLRAAGYTSYDQLFTAIKNLIPEPARSLYDYRLNPTSNTWELPPGSGIQGVTSTSDVLAEGWEVELTANPSRNWRISVNAAQVETITSNSAVALAAFQQAYLKNINDSKLGDVNVGPGIITIIGERYLSNHVAPTVAQRAKDGSVSQELRKYRINAVANYSFSEGRLKGVELGGGVRWQSKIGIGYATELNSFNQQVPIIGQPFFGPDDLRGDFWLGYSRKLTEKIQWKVQLNVRNGFGSQRLIPVAADPDGKINVLRIAPERTWYLNNTFSL